MDSYWNRFYVASKLNNPEAEQQVKEIIAGLSALGYANSLDWTKQKVERPFHEHLDLSIPAARAMVAAVKGSSIFIVRYADYMTGGLIEIGLALCDATTALGHPLPGKFGKRLLVVGDELVKEKSIFYVLEPFVFLSSTEALLKTLGPAKPLIDTPAAT